MLFFLLLLWSVNTQAQTGKTTATVVDDLGEPLIGAVIKVKENPQVIVVTDLDGKFQLDNQWLSKDIVLSCLGMQDMEAKFSANGKYTMNPESFALSEVVVTGMTSSDRRLFTGSTTKIDASKAKLDGVADISRSLEGRVAGVSVQNVSGTFGAAPKIRVRGATSIYGNSKPLWVVDGVVIEDAIDISSDDLSSGNAETLISSAIAGINADDIESIQVLKDGSATSIYGARAMSGVIVVTTKRGKAGTSSLNYTAELTMRLKPNYRDFNISNSQEQMGIYKELEEKGWLEFASLAASSSSGVYGKMYDLINTYMGVDEFGNPVYGLANTTQAKNDYLRQAEFRNTDWFDLLFNNSVMQNHSVSFSSGTEKSSYYMSLSAMSDPGWTASNNVQRYTFNTNGSYKINDALELKVQGSASHRGQKAPGTLNRETDVVSGEVKRGFDINPYSFALNTSRTLDPYTNYRRNYASFNIFHELDNNYIDLLVDDLKFQTDLTWRILPGWSANALGSLRYQTSSQEHYILDKSNMAMAYRAGTEYGEEGENETIRDVNPYLYRDPDNPQAMKETVLPKGGIYDRTNYELMSADFRLSSSYSQEFDEGKHTLNMYGGMELNSTSRSRVWGRFWGVQFENGMSSFFDPSVFKQSKEENSPYYSFNPTLKRNLAFFGTATYAYMHKYVANLTGRYEGTNKLGRSRQARWLPTYNIAGAWNMHEEEWFMNPVLSHSMLKASYSLTADAGPAFITNSLPIYLPDTPWRPSSSVMESGLLLAETENKDLTYEKKHEFNVGVDLGFLKEKINLVADYYIRNNFDLMGQIYTTGIGGGSIAKWANVASMRSTGFEFAVETKNIHTKDFRWNTDFVFTYQTTKITDLKSKSRVIDLITGMGYPKQGYPVRSLFSIPFVGLNEEGLPTFINEDGEVTIADIYFQENEKIDYLVYEGATDPPFTGSLNNTFGYKGIRLNLLFTYAFGNKVRMDNAFFAGYSDLAANPKEFKNRWVLPGDEQVTNIPTIASLRQLQNVDNLSYAYNAYNYSTIRTAKGDFIRLKEISVAYDIPRKWLDYAKVSTASVKLQATNLALLYADKKLNGQDPEFMNTGGVATPMPKQFTLSLRVGF